MDLLADLLKQITTMPPRGKPAAELTNRERMAVLIAAGVKTEAVTEEKGGRVFMTLRTVGKAGIADRGDGGYVVGEIRE